ncbi:adenylate kinase [Roseivirga sp.]|uniref:adenylate kinase n=1 Tax=Roseivirga sp. TaxID=1964215 RepID=UPI002B26AB5D|nr:adenylate kinase [Roseivirga sp.]
MVNIVLFGPPGAGKGTQSENIIKKYGLKHISTGDLFRKHLGEGTELGKKAQGFMDNGKLVPDEVVIGMVGETVKEFKSAPGFIFDGFPRTVAQAVALDELLTKYETSISCMVMLEVPVEELKKRLLERGKTSERADDQNEEKINVRIQEYNNKTVPVAEFYAKQNKICKVNGVGSIDSIFGQIEKTIDKQYA